MTFPETEQESFFVLLNVDIHVIAYKVTHLFVQSGKYFRRAFVPVYVPPPSS